MGRTSVVWVVFAMIAVGAACGCGDGDGGIEVDSVGARSGTRLRVQWLRAPDGAQVYQGMWDPDFETRCAYDPTEMAGVAVSRCLPEQLGTVDFSDDACTHMIARSFEDGVDATPRFAAYWQYLSATESAVTRLFRAGDLSTATDIYNLDSDGICRGPGPAQVAIYQLGEEIAVTDFVAGAGIFDDDVTTRLRRHIAEGEDGSRIPGTSGVYDTERGIDCSATTTSEAGGALHAAPPVRGGLRRRGLHGDGHRVLRGLLRSALRPRAPRVRARPGVDTG